MKLSNKSLIAIIAVQALIVIAAIGVIIGMPGKFNNKGADSGETVVAQSTEPSGSAETKTAEKATPDQKHEGPEEESDESEEPAEPEGPIARDNSDGTMTISGTVRVMGAVDLVQLQGHTSTPNGETNSDLYTVFVYDQPVQMTAKSSGNAGALDTRQSNLGLIELGGSGAYAAYDGQHIVATVTPDWWPSDTGLPLGEVRFGSFSVE